MTELGGTAAVVGGGSGIGRGIAHALGRHGVSVMVADIDLASAQAVRDEVVAAGGRADAREVDGTSRESLADLATATVDRFGGVNVLSTNVGVVADRPLVEATETDWAWFLECNLLSAVRAVDVFLPQLRATAAPRAIVVTASMAALLAPTGGAARGTHLGLYTTTKHALLGYAEVLRDELAVEGIGVSLLCPGMVQSNLGVTSARHRPERFGGPVASAESPTPVPGMDADEVGQIVVDGLRADRFIIVTHAAARRAVEGRQRRVLAAFDALGER